MYISKSYKHPDWQPHQSQNLNPHLMSLFFMYCLIRLFALELAHICSSIAWWDTGYSAAWKCFCRCSNNGLIFQARSYSMQSFEGSFWRLSVTWIFLRISINRVLAIVFNQWIIQAFINCPITFDWRKFVRSSSPEVFLRKGVLKICSKFTGEHPCRSVISTKLKSHYGMGVLL